MARVKKLHPVAIVEVQGEPLVLAVESEDCPHENGDGRSSSFGWSSKFAANYDAAFGKKPRKGQSPVTWTRGKPINC